MDPRIGTEVQVGRPRAGRPGCKAFVCGRTLFSGVIRPGRMHDQTAMRTEGIAEQLRCHPRVMAEVDEGYQLALGGVLVTVGEASAAL